MTETLPSSPASPAERAEFYFSDKLVECNLALAAISSLEAVARDHGQSSLQDYIDIDRGGAYDMIRAAMRTIWVNKYEDGTPKASFVEWDHQQVYDIHTDPAYDPTTIVDACIERAFPDRNTVDSFDVSIGALVSPEDQALFGESATRIALYELHVEPDNLAY